MAPCVGSGSRLITSEWPVAQCACDSHGEGGKEDNKKNCVWHGAFSGSDLIVAYVTQRREGREGRRLRMAAWSLRMLAWVCRDEAERDLSERSGNTK